MGTRYLYGMELYLRLGKKFHECKKRILMDLDKIG